MATRRRFSPSPTGILVPATPSSSLEAQNGDWYPSLAQRREAASLASQQSVEPDVDSHEYASLIYVDSFGITFATNCCQYLQHIREALPGWWDVLWTLERGVCFGQSVERVRFTMKHRRHTGSLLTGTSEIVLQTNAFDGDYVSITSSGLTEVRLPKYGTSPPQYGFLEIKDMEGENTKGVIFSSINRCYDVKVGEMDGRVVRVDVCGLLSGQQ